MPESFIQVPPNSTGGKLRTRARTVGANTIEEQYVIPIDERVVTNRIAVSSFRTLGNAAVSQTLFTVDNGAASGVLLGIRRLACYMDSTAALTTVAPQMRTSRTTASPTGGTVLGKAKWDTSFAASPAAVVARGATASDGGAATVITATMSESVWESLGQRLHTAVGQVLTDVIPCLPELCNNTPFILRPGEALMVGIVAIAAANNPATNHYVINCFWEEFTLP